ncbi:hypothetical protein TEQG_00715 [Trichophyton equinum CBS 127.97]|uniref:Secreted protein n=1 Tax=Trichophyton equinum (strain ATCC MYA-4606 / CBS 127.97) TaxID=559882 RepID=F2PIA7_TRIEC|nr:hypothetical protein TEQG_00715 [Trichophyton equinum CBS 127.97]
MSLSLTWPVSVAVLGSSTARQSPPPELKFCVRQKVKPPSLSLASWPSVIWSSSQQQKKQRQQKKQKKQKKRLATKKKRRRRRGRRSKDEDQPGETLDRRAAAA